MTDINPNRKLAARREETTVIAPNTRPASERLATRSDPARLSIARLTDAEIARLTREELSSMIEAADIKPIDRRTLHSLPAGSDRDWRRLMFATRTACQAYVERCVSRRTAELAGVADRVRNGDRDPGKW